MARVLKAARLEPNAQATELSAHALGAISEQAKKYLEAVRREAESLLEETRRKCELLLREAQSKAVAISNADTADRSASSAQPTNIERALDTNCEHNAVSANDDLVAQLLALHQSLESASSDWLRQWQNETVLLAIAIAEKLVRRQVEFDTDILVEWIQRAVAMVHDRRRMIIQVHPETLNLIKTPLELFVKQLGERSRIEIAPCETIDKIGAIVTTDEASMDVQLSSQLQRLEEELV